MFLHIIDINLYEDTLALKQYFYYNAQAMRITFPFLSCHVEARNTYGKHLNVLQLNRSLFVCVQHGNDPSRTLT